MKPFEKFNKGFDLDLGFDLEAEKVLALMAARASSNYIKKLLFQNSTIGAFGGLGAVRHSTSVPKICPKIPQLPKKVLSLTWKTTAGAIGGSICAHSFPLCLMAPLKLLVYSLYLSHHLDFFSMW